MNSLIVHLHAAARIAAKKALKDLSVQGHSQECPSSSIRPIVRDLTNYPKDVVETRLIHLAVLSTYIALITIIVGALFLLRYNVGLLALVSVETLFILTIAYLIRLIVSGFINYKLKFPNYYGSHYL